MFSSTGLYKNSLFKKKNQKEKYLEINICEPKINIERQSNINIKKRSVKCVILGDSGIGKTSIIKSYYEKNIKTKNESTLGATFWELIHPNGNIKINFWDTAGQERYNSLIPMYVRNCEIAILTFDLTNRDSFLNLKKWYNFVNTIFEKPKILVIGNKVDLDIFRVVSAKDIDLLIEDHLVGVIQKFETSALEGININELFDFIFELSEEISKKEKIEEKDIDDIIIEDNKCCNLM